VQDDEVADQLDLQGGQAVVFVDLHGIEALVREQGQQLGDPGLDQVDAGAFQRLQEARRQADGHAVLDPGLLAAAGLEAQEVGLGHQGSPSRPAQAARASSSPMWALE
jgi:hypothetical protein